MDYKSIIYQPGRVTRIIFNRPRYKNAISHPMYAEIEDAFDRAAADDRCKVLVVSGAGDNFSSGHDTVGGSPEGAPMLKDGVPPAEMRKSFASERDMWVAYWREHTWYTFTMHTDKLFTFPKPSIAMVHGYCIFGATHLAQMMDLMFATEDSLFLSAGFDVETSMSPRKTLEILYEHRFLTGLELHEYGIVNRVYSNFEVLERETLAYANRVADDPVGLHTYAKEQMHARMAIQGWPDRVKQARYLETWQQRQGVQRSTHLTLNDPNPEDANRQRFEGKGMARAPRAMANLKAHLLSQGKPVPHAVEDALARFAAQDPKAFWDKALHQSWRDPENVAVAEQQAKAYEETVR